MITSFFCKRVVSVTNLGLMFEISRTQMHFVLISRSFSSSKQPSFTVSYLINSCGCSPENALTASRKVLFESPEKPDSVLALLRDYGFTKTHISKIVSKFPALLNADPEKTLLPKLEFFRSVGFSGSDLVSILVSRPLILKKSLENHIIPSYNFLKCVLVNNENILKAFKNSFWIVGQTLQKSIPPNIATLQEIGVPMSTIKILMVRQPSVLARNREKFTTIVKKVIEMGFNPLKVNFMKAVEVSCQLAEFTFEHKMEVYRQWGLTDDEIMLMFRLDPTCMGPSEKKIMCVMDFLVNKMGWEPAAIARDPFVFSRSLEKKIIPRCSVVKVLQMKGLEKKDLRFGFLVCNEEKFFRRFMFQYGQDIPELLNVYQGKIGILELGFVSEKEIKQM